MAGRAATMLLVQRSRERIRSRENKPLNETISVDAGLVGKSVMSAARPEWGAGKVMVVKSARFEGRAAFRVSIQFGVGHKTLLVPPARLVAPPQRSAEEREETWIESIAGRTPDDRLKSLPEEITGKLGTLAERVAVLSPLFEIDGDDDWALLQWASRQTRTGDPLSHWTRDELHLAFAAFCENRDMHLRYILATAKQARAAAGGGGDVVEDGLAEVEPEVRALMMEVLRRPF